MPSDSEIADAITVLAAIVIGFISMVIGGAGKAVLYVGTKGLELSNAMMDRAEEGRKWRELKGLDAEALQAALGNFTPVTRCSCGDYFETGKGVPWHCGDGESCHGCYCDALDRMR